jgi:RimJ/RimL family protein N-acetyltransferase
MNDHGGIETERLVLRPLASRHAAALHEVFANNEAMRFWHEPPHRHADQNARDGATVHRRLGARVGAVLQAG